MRVNEVQLVTPGHASDLSNSVAPLAADFQPLGAMAGRITAAPLEQLAVPGEVHVPGMDVQREPPTESADKQVEKRAVQA